MILFVCWVHSQGFRLSFCYGTSAWFLGGPTHMQLIFESIDACWCLVMPPEY